ncbi:hypothetical protein BKI52_38985 [marine bacterium AO1-C]|nr:hypothetical protein BKI52_38985 [marine bacterium AO1-C]
MTTQPISKKAGETHELVLANRGSTGLTIQWEVSNEGLATVERLDNIVVEEEKPGDAIQTRYCIHLLKAGEVTVHFYQTQLWDDDFPPITLARLTFVVE